MPAPTRLQTVVRPERLARWREAADRDRRTLSDWVRTRLDDAAEAELGEGPDAKNAPADPKADGR